VHKPSTEAMFDYQHIPRSYNKDTTCWTAQQGSICFHGLAAVTILGILHVWWSSFPISWLH